MKYLSLIESRLQVHYAIQFIAASAKALIPAQPDYSHTTLEWNFNKNWCQTKPFNSAQMIRMALDPVQLNLMILDNQDNVLRSLLLPGKTIVDGFTWMRSNLA